jgi:hypothetical protein
VTREIQSIIKADAEDPRYANNLVQVCIINTERKRKGKFTKEVKQKMNKRVRLMLYDDDGNVVREVEGNGIIYYLVYEEEDEETKKTTVDSGIFGKLSPSELAVAVPSIFNMVKAAKEDKKEREE